MYIFCFFRSYVQTAVVVAVAPVSVSVFACIFNVKQQQPCMRSTTTTTVNNNKQAAAPGGGACIRKQAEFLPSFLLSSYYTLARGYINFGHKFAPWETSLTLNTVYILNQHQQGSRFCLVTT